MANALQGYRTDLVQREGLMQELQRGLFRPGWGHSARLQLVAQSIPAQVWVTDVKADESQLDVRGLTLDPAALNEWVAKLAASPLLQAQKLSSVQVDSTSEARNNGVLPATARPMWSFNLLSAVGQSVLGGKP